MLHISRLRLASFWADPNCSSCGRHVSSIHPPTIALVTTQVDSRTVWQRRLAEVDDDMETRLLRAQQAELPFTLQVPDKVGARG